MSDEPSMWTDEFGQTWELVRQRETCDVSDATLAFVLAMVCLVPGLAILAANVIWGLPEWLAPVDGALLLFGLANVIVSAKEQGL